jgi:hypothetical protein
MTLTTNSLSLPPPPQGDELAAAGALEEALAKYDEALAADIDQHGDAHPDVAMRYCSVGGLYRMAGKGWHSHARGVGTTFHHVLYTYVCMTCQACIEDSVSRLLLTLCNQNTVQSMKAGMVHVTHPTPPGSADPSRAYGQNTVQSR